MNCVRLEVYSHRCIVFVCVCIVFVQSDEDVNRLRCFPCCKLIVFVCRCVGVNKSENTG